MPPKSMESLNFFCDRKLGKLAVLVDQQYHFDNLTNREWSIWRAVINFKNCFQNKTHHDLKISRQLTNEKNRKTIFVEIDEVNDKLTIQIEIAIEIFVGRSFRVVTIV